MTSFSGHAANVADRVSEVFAAHPELPDHREAHPWLVGWLGSVASPIWFVAENPSATQVDRIHSRSATVESRLYSSQWAASRGDRLFRDALVEHGLKSGGPFESGGWNCYITNVMKSEVLVKDWNGTRKDEQLAVAEMWAPVLAFELEVGHPQRLVVLGEKAYKALRHLERRRLLPVLPPIERLPHYSYVMMRPNRQRSLPPGDPLRQTEWKAALGAARYL